MQTRYTVLNFVNFPHFTSYNKVAQSEIIRLDKISLRGRTLIKRSVGCILPPPPHQHNNLLCLETHIIRS